MVGDYVGIIPVDTARSLGPVAALFPVCVFSSWWQSTGIFILSGCVLLREKVFLNKINPDYFNHHSILISRGSVRPETVK